MWQLTSLILALGRRKQEDCQEFKANLGYKKSLIIKVKTKSEGNWRTVSDTATITGAFPDQWESRCTSELTTEKRMCKVSAVKVLYWVESMCKTQT